MPKKLSEVNDEKKDSSQTLKLLTGELHKQMALQRIWQSQDFKEHLLPLLSQDNKWLDPQSPEFKTDQEFLRAYNVSWARARAFTELITLLSNAEVRVRDITDRIEKDKKRNETTASRPSR